MKNKNKIVVKRRGRPIKYNWDAFVHAWKFNTNRDMAEMVGCTIPMVCIKRRQLIEDAMNRGETGAYFMFRGKPYTRARSLEC